MSISNSLSLDDILAAINDGQEIRTERIPTGIITLDSQLRGGAQPGKLNLICSITGGGKSSLAVHLACTAATYGHPVIFFHSEMSKVSDYDPRLISWITGIPYGELRGDRVRGLAQENAEFLNLIKFVDIKGSGRETLGNLRSKVESPPSGNSEMPLVIIDSIDKISRPGTTSWEGKSDLEAVCEELERLAADLRVPVWATTQANDEAHDNDVVTLKCLRDSRGKAFPCSLFLGLGMSDKRRKEGIATLTADKSRDGEKFQIHLKADFACQRFSDLNTAFEPF